MIPAKTTKTADRGIQELWDHGTLIGLSDAQLLGRFTEDPAKEADERYDFTGHRPWLRSLSN